MMCGISIIVTLERKAVGDSQANDVDESFTRESKIQLSRLRMVAEIEESLDMIAHHGLDSRGQWISENNRMGKLIES
jgi:hypothetical protein